MVADWFDNISIQKKLLVSFSIPIIFMLLVSLSVYKNTQSMVKDNHWVVHTHKAIARAQELLSLVVDMETGQRGYLLTGNTDFLEPYHLASSLWKDKVTTLAKQVDDNPDQVERLYRINALLDRWLSESGEKEIAQRQLVDLGEAPLLSVITLAQQKTGKAIIDEIRKEIAQFIEIENELIDIRVIESDNSANQTAFVLLGGEIFSVAISLLVVIWCSKRIRKRLELLLEATYQVSEGQLDKGASTLKLSRSLYAKDEVGQLTHSFQKMTDNLLQSDQKMRSSNEALVKERKKAEAAVKAKSEFLSTMSHEIRTPMNGVLGISQIIASQTKEPSTKENIDIILDSGQHLMTVLNDILDFSKVEENKLELEIEPFHFNQVLQPVCSALQPLANEKGIQLLTENNIGEHIELLGDRARLRQILFNLGGNAAKFTNQGYVLIQTDLNPVSSALELTVTDTGIGIPHDKHQHIFNSFEQADTSTTRKFGGTGLGLAIVKNLVNLMGGEIALNSAPGLGTRFKITLPMTWRESETSLEIETHSPLNPTNTHPLNILLVEDNRVNAIVAKGFCENYGHHVSLAESGVVAIERLKAERFDLILMDNHMPEMNGIEATRYIRQTLGLNILIFAYTADVFREAHDKFIEAGADHVLTKPLQQESFLDALHHFASRLPNHTNSVNDAVGSSAENHDNVITLHREPIEKLRLTEEEISQSEIIQILQDDREGLATLIDSTIVEFEESVDHLIGFYMAKEVESLQKTLHSIKGVALNLGLNTLTQQSMDLETQTKNHKLPEIEPLQKLINRLLVNIHQAQRIKAAYQSPTTSQINRLKQ
ncbi:CHASE3 domain-containing protein [Vibrio fortis]|uniref:CHASE3 domain-containing protein n=1 Tax=Vibrio fortis TaxID=212667 RepID=UPI003EBB18CF